MTTAGTWYPPSVGTGGFLSDALLLSNPPFATMANITALLLAVAMLALIDLVRPRRG